MDEDILGLQVSVDEVLAVQILESKHYLRSVEACSIQEEAALLLYELVKLSAVHVLHHHVQRAGVLLHGLHAHLAKS